ncbi:MAG: FAD-dependent pyridine nucleotide-disulfide oxidoreductase [Dactylosporangium sp.]|nr:FAD-dependent pyridine nucleotide-disulfide oxidoreductase [Dactylosporangium sp.]
MTYASLPVLTPDVLIIGAGPAGLTAARTLAPKVAGQVLVLDRESTAGGIPRHSDHPGYGIRDLHRMMTGPAYAEHLVTAAQRAGATIRTQATVTHWADDHTVEVTTPQGRLRVHTPAIILATGARERPRPARLIPGDRPGGVYTTGHLQNLVHLRHAKVGRKAVVVGGELVSWSAVVTLREAGCKTALMTTEYASPESYAAFNLAGRTLLRVPVAIRTRVTRIIGHGHLEAVEIEDIDTGQRRTVDCDTLVLTGDWIPDHELARWGSLDIDAATAGPIVDTALRTSRPGVFAIGNLVHAVDTADVAALDGAHVTAQVLAWLANRQPPADGVRIVADKPFRWVAPSLLRPGDPAPARNRLLLWTDELVRLPHVVVRQDGVAIAHRRLPWPASPGRVFRIPSSLLRDVNPTGGDVHVGLL